jgi:large subunit ribosomal protein L3
VFKGLKMPGHHGNRRKTVQNLKVVDVLSDRNVLLVKGAVPGARRGLVMVRRAVKRP